MVQLIIFRAGRSLIGSKAGIILKVDMPILTCTFFIFNW